MKLMLWLTLQGIFTRNTLKPKESTQSCHIHHLLKEIELCGQYSKENTRTSFHQMKALMITTSNHMNFNAQEPVTFIFGSCLTLAINVLCHLKVAHLTEVKLPHAGLITTVGKIRL